MTNLPRLILYVLLLVVLGFGIWMFKVGNTADPIPANSLDRNLRTYASSEHNRAAGQGDIVSRDWLVTELEDAGFAVTLQDIAIRQWEHWHAGLTSENGEELVGFPLWYPPANEPDRRVRGPLAAAETSENGDIAVLFREPKLISKLPEEDFRLLENAHSRGSIGAVIVTTTISGEPFAFNAWSGELSMPVLILGSVHKARIERLMAAQAPVTLAIEGEYRNTTTWNVIGKRPGSKDGTIVVSTPRTGWFKSAAERGPGIAAFVELAKWTPGQSDYDLVFVGTGGHELGHAGMDAFLKLAPPPDNARLWVHLGASIAAHAWESEGQRDLAGAAPINSDTRWILYSAPMALTTVRHFRGLGYQHSPAFISVFGEARDIHRAGYPRFVAFAGSHPYFHLPGDTAENTSGEILAPAVHAVQRIIEDQ